MLFTVVDCAKRFAARPSPYLGEQLVAIEYKGWTPGNVSTESVTGAPFVADDFCNEKMYAWRMLNETQLWGEFCVKIESC